MNIEFIVPLLITNSHHAHGMNIDHMIVSSLIHGLIYGVIFKIFHNVSPLIAGVIGFVGVALLWFYFSGKRR